MLSGELLQASCHCLEIARVKCEACGQGLELTHLVKAMKLLIKIETQIYTLIKLLYLLIFGYLKCFVFREHEQLQSKCLSRNKSITT